MTNVDICQIRFLEQKSKDNDSGLKCIIGDDIVALSAELGKYCRSNGNDIFEDLLLIAAAIDYCDTVVRRPLRGWTSHFRLEIPVYNLKLFQDTSVTNALRIALSILMGDVFELIFVERHQRADWTSPYLPLSPKDNKPTRVIAFSKGLDSLCVAGLHEDGGPASNLIRVRLVQGERNKNRHRNRSDKELIYAKVPYELKLEKAAKKESTQRSRGFRFAIVSGITACLSGANEVIVTESGQGSLGPAIYPPNWHHMDCRNHPVFYVAMTKFWQTLVGQSINYRIPRIFSTKGETLGKYLSLKLSKKIKPSDSRGNRAKETESCWKNNVHASFGGKKRQCGVCAACLLRRQSFFANGIIENSDTYIIEDLSAKSFAASAVEGFDSGKLESLGRDLRGGLIHLQSMAEYENDPMARLKNEGHIAQIAENTGKSVEYCVRESLFMFQRHSLEWESFLDSLGPTSFINEALGRNGI